MRSVRRSPEPDFLDEIQAVRQNWEELDIQDRVQIRAALMQDFGTICAYCQRPCIPASASSDSPSKHAEETIDHFRPRDQNRFPDLWLDWHNLVYACHRCNQRKGNQWPGYDDKMINQLLAAGYPQYTSVSEYVNPNADAGQRPAHEFFAFNIGTGEVSPVEQLEPKEWSVAYRTIRDIDLNDDQSELGENDTRHLRALRPATVGLADAKA